MLTDRHGLILNYVFRCSSVEVVLQITKMIRKTTEVKGFFRTLSILGLTVCSIFFRVEWVLMHCRGQRVHSVLNLDELMI